VARQNSGNICPPLPSVQMSLNQSETVLKPCCFQFSLTLLICMRYPLKTRVWVDYSFLSRYFCQGLVTRTQARPIASAGPEWRAVRSGRRDGPSGRLGLYRRLRTKWGNCCCCYSPGGAIAAALCCVIVIIIGVLIIVYFARWQHR